ncbi:MULTISPECIES: peptidylprolyl isomerase [Enterobacteriaceae]|uniref:peptidylprolyl isomerase n=1 Tax=Klebsiella sp. 141161 TaxID=3020037 RepID=UPI000DDD7D4F
MNRRLFIGGCLGLCAGAVALPAALKWLGSADDTIEMELDSGIVTIKLFSDIAPNHVARIKTLVQSKFYDGMPFSRVIDGFMAQTGEPLQNTRFDPRVMPKLAAEINHLPFERGTIGMARSRNPHSACHQFFITSTRARYLDQNYTVVGQVTKGMEWVDKLRRGDAELGTVVNPDVIKRMRLVTTHTL